MFKFKSLRTKIMVLVGILVTVALALIITFSTINALNMAKHTAEENTLQMAEHYSDTAAIELEKAMGVARTLAYSLEGIRSTSKMDRTMADLMLKNLVEKNGQLLGVWTCWEPNAFDGKDAQYANKAGSDATGRYIPYWYRSEGKVDLAPLTDYETPGAGDYYLKAKQSGKEVILDPYSYVVGGKSVMMTSFVVPIWNNGEVVGVAGVDMALDTFQTMIGDIKPYETGYASLISNNGVYIAYPDAKMVGQGIGDTPDLKAVKEAILQGEIHTTTAVTPLLNTKAYSVYAPLTVGNSETPWTFAISVPVNKMLAEANQLRDTSVLIAVVSIALIFAALAMIANNIVGPIRKVSDTLNEMGKGHLGTRMHMDTQDEIGVMATTLDQFADDLQNKVIAVLYAISEGDVSMNVSAKDERDEIAPALKTTIESIRRLVADSEHLAKAAVEGKLDTRADAAMHKGDYAKVVTGVNNCLDAVVEPLKEAAAVLSDMSSGNLQTRVQGDYRGDHAAIKDALNNTLRSLNEVLIEIENGADNVAAGSRQVSDGSQALAQGSTEQASAVEELTASITQIAAQTKQNAVNASQANELANQARTNADQGNRYMQGMLRSMQDINESSASIAKIIKAIDEIAFQTNILALNAAVEAARAGQHGKGFAVVAEEVRNLAARSANAAKETTAMIEGSIAKVTDGTRIANETAGALTEIVKGVEQVANLVGEIATASNEQANAIFQINKGVEQVSHVVQTNSATAQQSAAASEELSNQAETLREMVGNFQLLRDEEHGAVFVKTGHMAEMAVPTPKNGKRSKKNGHPDPHYDTAELEISLMDADELKS